MPYYYKEDKSAPIEEFSYPLSRVSCPLGFDKPVCDLTDEEKLNYYLTFSKEKIIKLNEKLSK